MMSIKPLFLMNVGIGSCVLPQPKTINDLNRLAAALSGGFLLSKRRVNKRSTNGRNPRASVARQK